MGSGFKLSEYVTVGGYFSLEYANGENDEFLALDDLAVLTYGELSPRFSYLMELESTDFYKTDFKTDTTTTDTAFAIERLYVDYKFSDYLSLRVGKQITPIGYWNLQPINVLRETTSNPLYSNRMFPKFLSGVDVYGFTPFDESLSYHIYLQGTEDLDDTDTNIAVDSHFGVSLEKKLNSTFNIGGSIGHYENSDSGSETSYFQINAKMETEKFSLFTESVLNYDKSSVDGNKTSKAVYVQSEYRFSAQHAVIARAEYFEDYLPNTRERIGIIGYSYRPVFPVSFKIEYQWHDDSRNNRLLSSFAVLF